MGLFAEVEIADRLTVSQGYGGFRAVVSIGNQEANLERGDVERLIEALLETLS